MLLIFDRIPQARALKEANLGLRGEGGLGSWRNRVNCSEHWRLELQGEGMPGDQEALPVLLCKKFVACGFQNKTFLLICHELKGISVFSFGSVATVLF